MNITATVKIAITDEEERQIKLIFKNTHYAAYAQYPGFATVIGDNALHILMHDAATGLLTGYAVADNRKNILATITFGPITANEINLPALTSSCITALQKKGIKIIRIQPPLVAQTTWGYVIKQLQNRFNCFSLPTELDWSTIVLNIIPSQEILLKSFSENHRRSIKKAINEELQIQRPFSINEMDDFAEGFCKMYNTRKIPVNLEHEKNRMKRLYKLIEEDGNGFIMLIKKEGRILGGIILIKENNKIFYLQGFSDPNFKKIPVNHLLFFKSFEIARSLGYTHFDFGGYGRIGTADEQVLNINRFKDGFRGKLVNHPDTILIAKNPFFKIIYQLYTKLKN